jgi:hypothetical protein
LGDGLIVIGGVLGSQFIATAKGKMSIMTNKMSRANNTRTLTFPVLTKVKRMFRKCLGKQLTDDDRASAAQFDVAKEIEKAEEIRKDRL